MLRVTRGGYTPGGFFLYCRHLLHRCEDAGLPKERNSIPPAVFAGVVPYGADGLLAAFSMATAVRWYFFPGMVVIFPCWFPCV